MSRVFASTDIAQVEGYIGTELKEGDDAAQENAWYVAVLEIKVASQIGR